MPARTNNHYLTLIFCFSLVLGLFFFSDGTTYAQSADPAGEETDPIEARLDRDTEQTDTEVEQLTELHEQDREACEAEAGVGGGGGSQGSASGSSGNNNGGTGIGISDENTTRAALAEAGWTINPIAANDCAGLRYQDYRAQNNGDRCTSVAGLPQHSIDRLALLQDNVENTTGYRGPLLLTGGTEAGHATHKPGNNIVDLQRNNAYLNNYIISNSLPPTRNDDGHLVYYVDGDQYVDEDDHWHVSFQGSATQQGQMQAMAPTVEKSWAGIWQQIQLALGPTVEAASFGHLLDLGDSLINLNTTSNTQINQLIIGMDNTSLNQLFSGANASAVNNLLPRLDFDTLNRTIGRLNENSLNNIMSLVTNDTFSNISPLLIEDSFNEIFEGLNRNTINQVVSGFTDGNLSTVFSTLSGNNISDIFGGLTTGMADGLLRNLGQGAINNVFGGLGDFQIDNLIGSLGQNSLNRVFTTLGGSTLNGVLEGLGGSTMESILPLLGNSGLTNMFSNGLPDVLNGALQGVAPEILGPVLESLPTDLVQDLAAKVPVVGELLGAVPGLGGLAGLAGLAGGLYVPVVEQNGQLMSHTESIDTTTQEVRDLSVQICTYLKQIARIQARFETARSGDADVSRIASSEVHKYLQAYFDWLQKGYVDNEGNADSGPLFVVNTRIYWQESALEGEMLARQEIKESNNPDATEILSSLKNDDLSTVPTITAQEIELLKQSSSAGTDNQNLARATDNIPILSTFVIKPFKRALAFVSGNRLMAQGQNPAPASDTSAEAYWDAWKKLVEPRNNRLGSYLIAQDLVNAKRQEAVEIAKHETLAAQGFLPVRECVVWASEDSKVCKVWQTNTPGILVKETASAGLSSRLRQYEQANSMGDIATGDEPNISEIIDLKPTPGGGGAPGPVSVSDPSDIPNTSNDLRSTGSSGSGSTGGTGTGGTGTGGTGSGDGDGGTGDNESPFPWESLVGLVDSIFSQDDEPDEDNNDLLQGLIAILLEELANQEPLVSFKQKPRENNEILLYWFAPNAETCVSGNAWLNNDGETLRAEGVGLTQKGSLRLAPPTAGATYEITCTNANGPVEKTVTIPALTP